MVGRGGHGSGNASFKGVITVSTQGRRRRGSRNAVGGRKEETICSLPNGIRPRPVASDVVATS
jgi:hypothetical protein